MSTFTPSLTPDECYQRGGEPCYGKHNNYTGCMLPKGRKMNLKLTPDARREVRQIVATVLIDLIDGDIDTPTRTAEALERAAAIIRQQNPEKPTTD